MKETFDKVKAEDAAFNEMAGLEIQPFLLGTFGTKPFTIEEAKAVFEKERPGDWVTAEFEGGVRWLVNEDLLSYSKEDGMHRLHIEEA